MQLPPPSELLNALYGLIKNGCINFMNEQREVLMVERAQTASRLGIGGPGCCVSLGVSFSHCSVSPSALPHTHWICLG